MRYALVLVAVVACGGGGDDASPDVDATPPPSGFVDVRVEGTLGHPLANLAVVFNAPNGDVITLETTDADGRVRADIVEGSSTTAIQYIPNYPGFLTSVLSINPGDDITISSGSADTTQIGHFTVTFDTLPDAGVYDVFGPCTVTSSTTTTVIIPIVAACPVTSLDLTVVAGGPLGPLSGGYLRKLAVPYQDGGSTFISGAWNAPIHVATTYTNVPSLRDWSASRSGVGADVNSTITSSSTGTPPLLASEFVTPPTDLAVMSSWWGISGTQSHHQRTVVVDGAATSLEIDVGSGLPALDGIAFDATTATFTKPDTGPVDVTYVELEYHHAGSGHIWDVYGPALTSFTLPQLPAQFPLYPGPGDDGGALVRIVEASHIAGYATARQNPVEVVNSPYRLAPLGTTTDTTISY
ncbi:MAG: hypothetical protein ABI867_21185 [Kofleriaceae bacterium]